MKKNAAKLYIQRKAISMNFKTCRHIHMSYHMLLLPVTVFMCMFIVSFHLKCKLYVG